jgi:acyl dehydratase
MTEARYYEDMPVGTRFETARRTITEADIVAFTNLTRNINPLHNDRLYVTSQTPYRDIIAPGLFTAGLTIGLLTMVGWGSGTAIALLASTDQRFPTPLYPGDTIQAETEVTASRETSKPDRGILTLRDRALNQDGEIVFEGIRTVLVRRRPAEDQA